MRITKDRETRRAELVDAAIDLFLEKGYENTMVSDIVHTVRVAQGTFYYYFKTKEAVLDAVLYKLLQENVERVERLAQDRYQSAAERVEGFFRMLFSPRGSLEVSSRYGPLLQEPVVREHTEEVRFRLLHRALRDLIEDGIHREEFRPMNYPGDAAEIALRGAAGFIRNRKEQLALPLIGDTVLDALAEFMERLLGMPDNSLDFRDIVIKRNA